eukprot:908413-Amphidinium_carterae.1
MVCPRCRPQGPAGCAQMAPASGCCGPLRPPSHHCSHSTSHSEIDQGRLQDANVDVYVIPSSRPSNGLPLQTAATLA